MVPHLAFGVRRKHFFPLWPGSRIKMQDSCPLWGNPPAAPDEHKEILKGEDIKELSLSGCSLGFKIPVENAPCQFVTVLGDTTEAVALIQEDRRSKRIVERERIEHSREENTKINLEGPCRLVIKPLSPDVHLNRKLFPVALFSFLYTSIYTNKQKELHQIKSRMIAAEHFV